jgi:hypothetical protein
MLTTPGTPMRRTGTCGNEFANRNPDVLGRNPSTTRPVTLASRPHGSAAVCRAAIRESERAGEEGDDTMDNLLVGACKHPGCHCTTGDDYCSDYCRTHGEHGDDEQHACDCGHDQCTTAAME